MKVVAEGVETAEQTDCLKAAGCDQVQGYFFARPMPAAAVPAFVGNWEAAAANAMSQGGPYTNALLSPVGTPLAIAAAAA